MSYFYDLIVVGSGPGGYVAAIRAAQLGLKTAIVEREHLGGICLNWGCIPSKALLRSAEIYRYMSNAKSFGLKVENHSFDIKDIVNRSRSISRKLNEGVRFLLEKNKIDVIWGQGHLTKLGEITVSKFTNKTSYRHLQHPVPEKILGEGSYHANHVIIATGARPKQLSGIEVDGKRIWSYFEALVPKIIPKSLIIMGSGSIGMELASFYNTLGSTVTVIELMNQVMPVEDQEISDHVKKQFEKKGVRIILDSKVISFSKEDNSILATIEDKDGLTKNISAEYIVSAVGVVGNIEGLGLDNLGIAHDHDIILVDSYGATNVPGIYAIGDIAGSPMLAHKASHEGIVCVEKIAGLNPRPLNKEMIPGCTYCDPQIANLGMTEGATQKAGKKVKIGRFPFSGNGKALAFGESEGLIKTIFDLDNGQLLGVHMIGVEVTELIQGFVVAMNLETTEEELINTVFPHPTLSEVMHESVLDSEGRALHI
ncbi:dihydrolipoyl dehydrogenase [Candidatus Endowatersipora endosymbiont of Watersipora subatra]|uniref:dihydrolipoyl dehydrogenase n=1 Tax=Candidatus Endowatersipora endosymbiont of Watersipora subatra TaxID=3077946 RepID=UPI00312C7508